MDYFVMDVDVRTKSSTLVDYTDPGFLQEEPFVAYSNFAADEKLADFLWGYHGNHNFFCISDDLKKVVDSYDSLIGATPVFLTDIKYRGQRVYWNIEVKEYNCLKQKLYADWEELEFQSIPNVACHMFQAININRTYLVVSLELAENMLRRQMYGLKLYPVKSCGQGEEQA